MRLAADMGGAGIDDMLTCLAVKGYTPWDPLAHMGTCLPTLVGMAGVYIDLDNMAFIVAGFVDRADTDSVFFFLRQHFEGSSWCYREPEGYDLYDAIDVMIMSRERADNLTEWQARQLIADNGYEDGRIPRNAFYKLQREGSLSSP